VPIEVTAFEILKGYTESLSRYFANEEGKRRSSTILKAGSGTFSGAFKERRYLV